MKCRWSCRDGLVFSATPPLADNPATPSSVVGNSLGPETHSDDLVRHLPLAGLLRNRDKEVEDSLYPRVLQH